MSRLSDIEWDDLQKLAAEAKTPFFMDGDRIRHVITAQQFKREQLEQLGALATRIRFIAKKRSGMDFLRSLLPHKGAMLYFTQPSTRTFLSFSSACQLLGMRIGEVRDTATSSEFKGESKEDSVRTFSSYFDLIVMRSQFMGLAERMAWVLSRSERAIPVINAGSGKDEHPTQALLDIYTLQRSFERRGGIDGKRIVYCGDLARGRTVRSLALLLSNYRNVGQCFVAPAGLQLGEDVQALLRQRGVEVELREDFAACLPDADAVYMTRVQDEWDVHKGDSARIDFSKYSFGTPQLELLKPDAILMHPLPRRDEIAVEVDRDPRAMYWRQMRNGMWIRTAVIATMFGCEAAIAAYREER